MRVTAAEIAHMVDLSAVKTESDESDVRALAATARRWGCGVAYTLPGYTSLLSELLRDRPDITIGGVVGFPAGGDLTAVKVAQARALTALGCGELDMVINVGWLRSGCDAEVEQDIRAVVEAAEGRPVKAIIEVAYLNEDQIRRACEACIGAGATFVKTGTGWAPAPTTVDHIRLIKAVVGDRIQIKPSGGIRERATVVEMLRLGASRFGMGLQHAVRLFEEWEQLPGGALEI